MGASFHLLFAAKPDQIRVKIARKRVSAAKILFLLFCAGNEVIFCGALSKRWGDGAGGGRGEVLELQ